MIRFIRENQKKAWFCFALNGLLLLFFFTFFYPSYETNDDMSIVSMVNGMKGSYDAHLIFIHYLIGAVLKILYQITGAVAWYSVLQYVFLYLAFSSLTYAVSNRMRTESGMWLFYVVLCFFAYEGYVKMQFTKTAGIVSAAGIFLVFYGISLWEQNRRLLLCGILLTCAGSMYRFWQFLVEAALLSPVGLLMLLELAGETRRQIKKIGMLTGCSALLFLAVFGCRLWDLAHYRSEEWQDFLEYNISRAELYDYGFPSYDENEDAYEALGIDRTAYQVYRGWNQMDPDKFSTEIMQEIIALKTPKTIDRAFLSSFFEKFPKIFFSMPCFYCFLTVFLYWLIWGERRWKDAAAFLYGAAVLLGIYFYLFYRGRYALNRVDVGIWFGLVLSLVWMCADSKKEGLPGRAGVFFLASVLLLQQSSWRSRWRINSENDIAEQAESKAYLETIRQDKEHLYLVKAGTISLSAAYGAFESIPVGVGDNIFPMGGWSANTPLYRAVAEQYGVRNPFCDLIDNPLVYLIDNNIEQTLNYIQTYYDENASYIQSHTIGEYAVYQIVSE